MDICAYVYVYVYIYIYIYRYTHKTLNAPFMLVYICLYTETTHFPWTPGTSSTRFLARGGSWSPSRRAPPSGWGLWRVRWRAVWGVPTQRILLGPSDFLWGAPFTCHFLFFAFCQGMLGLQLCANSWVVHLTQPRKVKLLEGEQKATES